MGKCAFCGSSSDRSARYCARCSVTRSMAARCLFAQESISKVSGNYLVTTAMIRPSPPEESPLVGRRYRHCKGGEYIVVTLAQGSADGAFYVCYAPLAHLITSRAVVDQWYIKYVEASLSAGISPLQEQQMVTYARLEDSPQLAVPIVVDNNYKAYAISARQQEAIQTSRLASEDGSLDHVPWLRSFRDWSKAGKFVLVD